MSHSPQRFRPKYNRLAMYGGYALTCVSVSWLIACLLTHTHIDNPWGGIPLMFICFINLKGMFLYWTFEETGIVQHFLWRTYFLPYSAIRSVSAKRGKFIRLIMNDNLLAAEINPRRFDEFILSLRQHAFHADFEILGKDK